MKHELIEPSDEFDELNNACNALLNEISMVLSSYDSGEINGAQAKMLLDAIGEDIGILEIKIDILTGELDV